MSSFWMMIGRFCLSTIFVFASINKFINFDMMSQYVASKGVPNAPILLICAAIIELLGGVSVFLGVLARWGAAFLALLLIPITYFMHDFWNLPPEQMQGELIHFLSNLAIFGGLLYVCSCGAGKFSIDGRTE